MFSGKVVLITGASSGIGAATAVLFAKEGAKLSLTGRNKENLREVASECEKLGQETPHTIVGDLTSPQFLKEVLESTLSKFSKLDVLVNSAGATELGSIEDTCLEQFDRVFSINVKAVYELTRLAVPALVATQGNIVNVCSTTATCSYPGVLAYSMSKSAVDKFTKCVALELAPKQVRVNCVSPGVTRTRMMLRAGFTHEECEQLFDKCRLTHALGRATTPQDVAAAIAFLASDQASFITAANLPVDGGRHAMALH